MECNDIENILRRIFKRKYPELKFECEGFNLDIKEFTYYKIFCRASREFFNSSKFDRKDIEPEIRSILKMMGIFDHVRIFFEYED